MSVCIHKKLTETKVLRDPVHEYIRISDEVIWNLIDTKEFQRLRRIHQLGGTYQVYHGAEHSRFSHSLGVYEISRRMIEEVRGLKSNLTQFEQISLKCAALLHDVGHGPFSHAFESVIDVDHEQMSIEIIIGDTQVNEVLRNYDEKLPEAVAQIINHKHPKKLLTQLVSAQLDADRMDYLLRDSFFTGVSYGHFDLERILRTLMIHNNQVVVKESGINAVEDYIMARYQMYWQVYFHPVSRSFEIMLTSMFKAIKDIYQKDADFIQKLTPFFVPFINGKPVEIEAYLFLDEPTCYYGFKVLSQQNKYPVLSDLARRLLDRDLFKYIDNKESLEEELETILRSKGYDPTYYLDSDRPTQRPYIPYRLNNEDNLISILMRDGQVEEITQVSTIVEAMAEAKLKQDNKLFSIKEAFDELQKQTK